jgi:hypothetical protein
VPEIGVFGGSHLTIDQGSGGPCIDQFGRCSDPTYFAAGNVLRPVETAWWSYREGCRVGGFVADDLSYGLPNPGCSVRIVRGAHVKLVVPQHIVLPMTGEGLGHLQLRFDTIVTGDLTIEADGQCIWQRKIKARPEQRVLVSLANLRISSQANAITIGARE